MTETPEDELFLLGALREWCEEDEGLRGCCNTPQLGPHAGNCPKSASFQEAVRAERDHGRGAVMAESRPVDRWISETLAAMPAGQPERKFYLLICRECGDGDLVMPFDSPAGRGKWAAAHTRGTGHDRWFVTESTTRLSPEQVTEMLARHDETVRWWRSD